RTFVQELLPQDFGKRSGILNKHNIHTRAEENHHITQSEHYQNEFRINMWAGVFNNFLIDPHILSRRLNGNSSTILRVDDLFKGSEATVGCPRFADSLKWQNDIRDAWRL
ncbi:hypothetical protein NQ318_013025, partial [Aromia moschata]